MLAFGTPALGWTYLGDEEVLHPADEQLREALPFGFFDHSDLTCGECEYLTKRDNRLGKCRFHEPSWSSRPRSTASFFEVAS